MSSRLRAVTLVFGISAALLLALFATAGPLVAAKPQTRPCPVAGLNFSKTQEGVTYSVAVAGLKAKIATCATARSIAGTVAKDLLAETKVPARIAGFNVAFKEPCSGCTPTTSVIAKSGEERITFTLKGGA